MLKNILIISFFFPPSSKAGAHRAISMAEFLPQFGWEPIFITVPPDEYYFFGRRDDELLKKVEKFQIYRIASKKFLVTDKTKNTFQKILDRLREHIIIPDSRVLWNISVKKKLDGIISKHKPSAVFITATPFSSFLLASFIKKKYNLPIVLDYRDPYSNNPLALNRPLRRLATVFFEPIFLRNADLVTTASYYMVDFIKSANKRDTKKLKFFPFPYGFSDKNISGSKKENDNHLIKMVFAGSMHGSLNIRIILAGLKKFLEENRELGSRLQIACYGTLFGHSKNALNLIEEYNIQSIVHLHGFLPYREMIEELINADYLILPLGDSAIANILYPTKLFDYLKVKNPIFFIGGKGQVWDTINNLNAGLCVAPNAENIAKGLKEIICGDQNSWYDKPEEYEKLTRKKIFSDLNSELRNLINE